VAIQLGQAADMHVGGDEAVGDEQQPVVGMDGVGRLGGAARDHQPQSLAAQPVDGGGEIGRHPLDRYHDRIGPRGRGEPRLALEQGAPGQRQSGAEPPARRIGLVIGGDKRSQRHGLTPIAPAIEGRAPPRKC
jgi:hypothetical protein